MVFVPVFMRETGASCDLYADSLNSACEGFTKFLSPIGHPLLPHLCGNAGFPAVRTENALDDDTWKSCYVGKLTSVAQLRSRNPRLRERVFLRFKSEVLEANHVGCVLVNFELTCEPHPMLIDALRAWLAPDAIPRVATNFLVSVPLVTSSKASFGCDEPRRDSSYDNPWHWWRKLRDGLGKQILAAQRFSVILVLPDVMSVPEVIVERWCSEPVAFFALSTSSFTLKDGRPVLYSAHKEFAKALLAFGVSVVISGPVLPFIRLGSYVNHLYGIKESLSESCNGDAFGVRSSINNDHLLIRVPEPFIHDAVIGDYQRYAEDSCKYFMYRNAFCRALGVLGRRRKDLGVSGKLQVAILGAGCGSLVETVLSVSEASGIDVVVHAVEKNLIPYLWLESKVTQATWKDCVHVYFKDSRFWQPPQKLDAIFSDFLGSFGDDQCMTECVRPVEKYLEEWGLVIPSSVTAFLTPIQAPMMHASITSHLHCWEISQGFEGQCPWLFSSKSTFGVSSPSPVHREVFPKGASKDWTKQIEFTPVADATIHGLEGGFQAILLDGSGELGNVKHRPGMSGMDTVTWYPMFFPLQNPLLVERGGKITVTMSRKSDEKHVWYEWSVELGDKLGLLSSEEQRNRFVHNLGGQCFKISLQKCQHYLDHFGTTLFAKSQIENLTNDLIPPGGKLLGNPHSNHAPSRLTTDLIDQARLRYGDRILEFLDASAEDYDVVFTSGATGAIKIVAESFDFSRGGGGIYLYTQENHTSVFGARRLASRRGASVYCVDADELLGITQTTLEKEKLERVEDAENFGLFAYPATSNFSGRKFPLDWCRKLRDPDVFGGEEQFKNAVESLLGPSKEVMREEMNKDNESVEEIGGRRVTRVSEWFVLLDAASHVGTSPLRLSRCCADFVCLSFYKVFGFPTGIGALVVRKQAGNKVLSGERDYFGGGTVAVALTKKRDVVLRTDLSTRFEDGTVSFLSIISLLRSFDVLARITGSMIRIQDHVFSLVQAAFLGLKDLKHANGAKVTRIYGVKEECFSKETHGSALAFNLLRSDGSFVGFSEAAKMFELHDVSVRTGCFCNPGACQKYLNMSDDQVLANYKASIEFILTMYEGAGHVCGDGLDLVNGRPTGCIRISFGYMSGHRDVSALLRVIAECFVDGRVPCRKSSTFAEGVATSSSSSSRDCFIVTDLRVYPVKSCAAFYVPQGWDVVDTGLAYDRTWMVADARGVALAQKREPRLCLIKPRIDLAAGRLWLCAEGMPDISTALEPDDTVSIRVASNNGPICQSKVCGDRVRVLDCGDELSAWLKDALYRNDFPRLLRIDPHFKRRQEINSNGTLTLTNEAQFLIVSTGSVRDLMGKLTLGDDQDDESEGHSLFDEEELLDRFRPNIVIECEEPYVEDVTKEFIFDSGLTLKASENVGQCSRCQMICIDQRTGAKASEPLTTLAATRGPKIPFGVHCCLMQIDGQPKQRISVNSTVKFVHG
ncbi:unnamed protein product [Notodromas monacha]|uniref:Molybdenum cofactor sulfurase n=1 Tax=Notodromas monacha TaxID=399045 RepID=A0A7R9BDY9_9CRUS|nr:unnamed protein product [Notodromas monacha]CAG0912481.1 unnamed protein product [Notodromas monacha]